MIKTLIVGRRAAGRSRQSALAHLRDIHGPMVVCAPDGIGTLPCDYVQNHVFDGAYTATGGLYAIERDLATQLWFDSLDAMKASGVSAYYLANMKPDEPRFVDDPTVAKMLMTPRTIVDGPRGGFKLFALIGRAAAASDADWAGACARGVAGLAAGAGVTALVENTVVPSPAGDRFVDLVLEAWLDERAAAAALVGSAETVFAPFGTTLDRERSFVLAAEEFPRERLRALHRAAA